MRVLHVISSLDERAGGPSFVVNGLASSQADAGLDVSVLATYRPEESATSTDALKARGIDAGMIGPTAGPLRRHRDLAKALAERVARADVVHVHALWEEIQHLAAVFARNKGIPYVVTPHGMLDPWSLSQSRLKKRLYLTWRLRRNLNRAALIHFTTSAEQRLTAPLKLRAPGLVEPIGVDLAEFDPLPPRGRFRAAHPKIGERLVVLFMGRLHHKKGLDQLVPAFGKLADRDAVLVIAGPDADGYQADVEKMAAAAGVGDRVVFPGMLWREKRVEALVDADVFALPSYQENFGVAVVESLAAGTPVVISDQVNLQDQIAGAGVGAVIPLGVEGLTRELDRWLGDADLRRAAGEKARAFARERFGWGAIGRHWVGHYESLLRTARG